MPRRGQTIRLLITGTDTGVGKTFVACGIAAAMRRRGLRVAPFKPVETGCDIGRESEAGANSLLPADARLLQETSGTESPLETICPYRFRTPVAPWVAAAMPQAGCDYPAARRCDYSEPAPLHHGARTRKLGLCDRRVHPDSDEILRKVKDGTARAEKSIRGRE